MLWERMLNAVFLRYDKRDKEVVKYVRKEGKVMVVQRNHVLKNNVYGSLLI